VGDQPDGKTYTFTLRQGLQWSDGQPLNADDVVFTFNDLLANAKIPTDWPDILKIEGKMPKVEKVTTSRSAHHPKPFAPFLRSAGGVSILPKHILAATLKLDSQGNPAFNQFWGMDTDVKSIVGNGPFVLEEFLASQRVVYKRNPYYWRKINRATNCPTSTN